MGDINVDRAALADASERLVAAGEAFDSQGASHVGGDFGAAAALVNLVLAAHADAASRVAGEAQVIAWAISLAVSDLEMTDAQQAIDIVDIGRI